MPSFIAIGYVRQILRRKGLFALPHPWAIPKRSILNRVNPTRVGGGEHFFTLLLNCFSVDNGTLWLFLNIIKKHCDSKIFSLYPMGVTWRHHFEQQLDGAKICKFQLFMLCAYLRNKQVYFEIIACKTKTIINVWLLIISGNDYVIMTSSG